MPNDNNPNLPCVKVGHDCHNKICYCESQYDTYTYTGAGTNSTNGGLHCVKGGCIGQTNTYTQIRIFIPISFNTFYC